MGGGGRETHSSAAGLVNQAAAVDMVESRNTTSGSAVVLRPAVAGHQYLPQPLLLAGTRRGRPEKPRLAAGDAHARTGAEPGGAAGVRHECGGPLRAGMFVLLRSRDAEVAYAMVRHHKPKRVIEVGGGYSTRLIANALQRNAASDGKPGELITIEPFPEEALRNGFPGLSMLIADPAQKVDVNLFASLSEGDVLFVDSSHVVKTGSDVCYECLQILPRLKPGVLVHFHDIFLPCEYPRQAVLERLCFWSEQYLLQAFLAMNDGFEVLWAASAMQLFHPEVVESAIPRWRGSYTRMPPEIRRFQPTLDGDRVWPASFWMRRKPQPA